MITSDGQGIGPTEAMLLAWADREDRRRITTSEAAAVLGDTQASHALSSLTRKGLLTRIAGGVYLVRTLGALGTKRAPTGLALVGLLLDGEDYYVGGRSAASLHHLTTQRFSAVLDVYAAKRIHSRTLGSARLVIHPMPAIGSSTGVLTTRAQDVEVRASDPERTVLDLVDRFRQLLGWHDTEQLVLDSMAERRLDISRLVSYAANWDKHSTVARLGVLLERAGVNDNSLQPLVSRFATYHGDTVLVPGGSRRGRWYPRFRVILNDAQ